MADFLVKMGIQKGSGWIEPTALTYAKARQMGIRTPHFWDGWECVKNRTLGQGESMSG